MELRNLRFFDGAIYVNNSISVEPPSKITSFVLFGKFLFLLLEPDGIVNDRNLFCYSIEGYHIWTIGQPDTVHHRNYYVSISLSPDNKLIANNVNGIEYVLNLNDGAVVKTELIK